MFTNLSLLKYCLTVNVSCAWVLYNKNNLQSLGLGTVLQAFNPIIWESETDEEESNLVLTAG